MSSSIIDGFLKGEEEEKEEEEKEEERAGMGEEGCGGGAAGQAKVEALQLQVDTPTVGYMSRM